MKLNLKYLITLHAARGKTKGHYGYISVTKVFLTIEYLLSKGDSACNSVHLMKVHKISSTTEFLTFFVVFVFNLHQDIGLA